MKFCKLLILLFILQFDLSSQIGFHHSISNEAEPNVATIIHEYDDGYIIGGEYYDLEIGRWTGYFAKYSEEGTYEDIKVLRSDTVSLVKSSNNVLQDSSGIYIRFGYGGFLKFDLKRDSVYVKFDFVKNSYSLISTNFVQTETYDTTYYVGRWPRDTGHDLVRILRVSDRDTLMITDSEDDITERLSISAALNEEGNLHVGMLQRSELGSNKCYIHIYDKDLNLIFNGLQEGETVPLYTGYGSVIDKSGCLANTGRQYIEDEQGRLQYYPAIVRFLPNGKVDWWRKLGNNKKNSYGWAQWNAIIESKEKDGYIVVGSEINENEFQDSLLARAAISKISYTGDSIWTRTYTFRKVGHIIHEAFKDVILSSDGHYVASGNSYRRRANGANEEGPWIHSIIVKMNDKGIYDLDGTSTINLSKNNKLIVYPNPTTSRLYITQSENKSMRGEVLNQNGVIVETFISDGRAHTHIMDVSNYSSGIYYLVAKDKQGNRYSGRFVVR